MPTIAYLANQFPATVEPYVEDEILELRCRGARVITATARSAGRSCPTPDISLQPLQFLALLESLLLLLRHAPEMAGIFARILFQGRESLSRRIRCLLHTWLGAYYAVLLQPFDVDHIHAHHGYFSSWVAMVAARLLHVDFSLTLHGSDLLVHGAYLDTKLAHCAFCLTISEFNRAYILEKFPHISPAKIIVQRLGVDSSAVPAFAPAIRTRCMVLLSIGRLHPVKNHSFLLDACARLRDQGVDALCLIAGDGPERRCLEQKIAALGLTNRVSLLGHVPHAELEPLYTLADVVVLTSRSEGIPLALMEAMMREKLVLAPSITGIPELVKDDQTGFLFQPGSLDEFVARLWWLRSAAPTLDDVRHAARVHALAHFDRDTNLHSFGDVFLTRMRRNPIPVYESPVLQQI
jgi:colanic acid/amylovoran biosynthesis glycosyltransferase